ncbi:MAG: 23S rRNA (guanosine(2251)-2'-O)-methyltransferase RlmB [Kiritimatiellaeota bacterium]|nr:23S rRNA (guanosine(2251)-2'-O)-methyltransferase RlmB [Kiritimatiellota bacterium]
MPFKKPWERSSDRFGDRDRSPESPRFKKPWEKSPRDFNDRPRFNDDNRRDSDDRPRFNNDRPRDDRPAFKKPWERSSSGGGFGAPRDDRPRDDDRSRDNRPFRKPWEKSPRDFNDTPRDRPPRPRFDDRRDDDASPHTRHGNFKPPFKKAFQKPWEKHDSWERDGSIRADKPFRKPWEKRPHFEEGGARSPNAPENHDGFPARPFKKATPVAKIPTAPEGELLYGRQPVRETLRAGRRVIKKLILGDHVKDTDEVAEIKSLAEAVALKIEFHKKETLEAWANGGNHQGVAAVCEEYPYADSDEIIADLAAKEGNAIVVVLDHIVDPQNLGSLIRTCEAAGAVGVFLPVHKAAEVTPAAVRASAGAAEHIKIARVSNLVSVLEKFKENEVWITGLEALPDAKPYTEIDYKGKACLVIGSEGNGLSTPVRKACDNLARLPLLGKVGSLNAGVAGALAIYEALRQQGV